ncbi:MAG TPA: hypothetical protein ENG39_00410 [Candidatus Omnitrophica bacterium]|nr:hypothetical protein [Candidatus Omnitrophota bacterium]
MALLLQEGINNPSIYTDPKWDLRKKIYDKNGNLIGVDLGGGFYIDTVNHPGYKEGVFCAPDGQPILVNGQPLQEKDAQIATTYFVEFENGKMVLKNAFGDVVKLGRGLFSKTPVVDNFRVDFKVGKIFVEKSGEVIPLKFDVVAFKVPHTDKYQLFYRGKDIPFATITSSEMMDEGSFLIYFDENKSPNLVSYEGRYLRVHVVGKDYRRDPESQVFTFVGKARKALEDMVSAGELSSEERDQLLCLGILGDVSALHIGGVGGEPIRYFAIADQDNVYTPNSIREIIAIAIANPQYGIFQPFLEQANVAESGYARWSANLPQQLLRFTGLGNMVLGSAQFMGKGVIDMNAYREAMMEPGNEALLPFTRCHDFLESINLPTAYLPDVVMKEDAPTSWFIDLLRNKGWRVGDWIGILNEWLPHTTLGRLYNIARGNEDPGPLPPEGRRIMNFILNANLMPIGFAGFLVSNYLGALFPGWIKMGDPVKDLIVLISTFTSIIAIPNFIGAIGYKIQNGEYPSNIARAAQEFVKDLTKGLTNLVISTVTLMQSLYDQPQHVGEAVGEVRNIQRGKPMIWRPMAALEDAQPSSLIEAYRQRAIPVGIATGLLLGAIATSTIYENGGISWAEWASPILSSFIIGPLVGYLTGRSATPIKDAMLEVEREDAQFQRVGDALLSLFGNDLERKFALVKSMFSNIYAETTRLIGNKDTIWNRLTSEQQRRLIDILHVSEEEAKDLIYTYCNSILERKLQNEREKRGKEEAKLQEIEEAKAHIIYAQALYTALYWGQWSRDEGEILRLLHTIYEKYGLDGLVLPVSKEEKITVDFARFRDDFDKLWAQIIAPDTPY